MRCHYYFFRNLNGNLSIAKDTGQMVGSSCHFFFTSDRSDRKLNNAAISRLELPLIAVFGSTAEMFSATTRHHLLFFSVPLVRGEVPFRQIFLWSLWSYPLLCNPFFILHILKTCSSYFFPIRTYNKYIQYPFTLSLRFTFQQNIVLKISESKWQIHDSKNESAAKRY